jgi:hypothetical protein
MRVDGRWHRFQDGTLRPVFVTTEIGSRSDEWGQDCPGARNVQGPGVLKKNGRTGENQTRSWEEPGPDPNEFSVYTQ